MNKKLTSLLLAMAMGLGMFAGCANGTSDTEVEATADTEESARVSMTLTLALPADNFTEESRQQVEAALNRLTQAKYDTAIELRLFPRDEYRDAYMAQIDTITNMIAEEEAVAEAKRQELKELKKQGITVTEAPETAVETQQVEETIINELGITIKQYPEVGEKQFDIFLVTNYDDYNYLIENELIQQLDGELGGNSKLLKTYIYPTFLNLANVGGTYAIPNNHPVGTYKFLLVNKELVDTYYYDPDSLKTLVNCNDFIKDIGMQNLEGVTPLLGEVETSNMVYWGEDPNEWSVIASQITNTASQATKLAPKSIFAITNYVKTVGMMKELGELGYIGDGKIDEGEKFAVGVIEGDASVYETYGDDYYVHIYSKPMFKEEDAYGAMFAVSSYSKSLARSMEIITYLNTSSDIRTVLQYGAQGIHWDYEDEDTQETIKILSSDYQMRLTDTGNVYMTYPGEGKSMADWDFGKKQNIESITSPYMKFTGAVNEVNAQQVKDLTAISKSFKERLDAATFAEYDALITAFKAEIKEEPTVSALLDSRENENSLVSVYSAWYEEMNPPA